MIIFNDFRLFIEYRMQLKTSKSGQQANFASKTYIIYVRRLSSKQHTYGFM